MVWNMNGLWPSHHIGNVTIPTDFNSIIFQRGRLKPPPRVWEIYGNWHEQLGFLSCKLEIWERTLIAKLGESNKSFLFLSSFNKSKVMEKDKLCTLWPGWDGPQKDAEQSETWKCVANICKYHTYHLYKTIPEALFDLSGCYCKAF